MSLQGFGTLGLVYSSQSDADFNGNLFQPNGAGHTRDISGSVDSKVGLQLDADINQRLTAITQIVSEYQYDGSYTPAVEWAYLQYRPVPELSLRVGRIVTAPFMESQSRLVSYSQPWSRLPNELYSLNPITHKDGVDARYQFPLGEVTHSIGASWGATKEHFANGANVDVKNLWEFEYRLDMGASSARLAYSNINFDLNSNDLGLLADGFDAFSDQPGADSNARLLRNRGGTYEIFALGLQHQPGRWLLRGEVAAVRTDARTFISDAQAWYLTVGHRWGRLTPYITFAEIDADRKTARPLSTDAMTPAQADAATVLNQNLEAALNSFAFDQRSAAMGLRWDPVPGLALKLQLDHVKTRKGAANTGRLVNPQPDFEPGDSTNVVSLSMDFVF